MLIKQPAEAFEHFLRFEDDDSYFGIRSTPALPHQYVKIPVILTKVQVTAKHAGILRMWPWVKWRVMVHGCTVYTERDETADVSRGTIHITPQTVL